MKRRAEIFGKGTMLLALKQGWGDSSVSALTSGKRLHISVSCSINWDGAVCWPSCGANERAWGLAAPSHSFPSQHF